MDTPVTRDRIRVEVLGVGAVCATVEDMEPARYHGIPGLVWRVPVSLPDGTRCVGFATASGERWFADPRVRASEPLAPLGRHRPHPRRERPPRLASSAPHTTTPGAP